MPINKRRLQVLIAAPITLIAAAYGVYWLVPNVRDFAREQEQQSAYAACRYGTPSRGGFAYGPLPAEAKKTGELPCSRSWWDPWHAPVERSYLLEFVKEQSGTMLAYLGIGLIGPWLLSAFLVRCLPWGFGRLRWWLTTANGGSGPVASTGPAAPAPRTDRHGSVFSDLRLRHTARWVVGICALLLIMLPVLERRPLIVGIYLTCEPLGFAALVFVLTFWVIPGSPAQRRSARQEAYAALLYVLAALDALVFHLVL
jgi:hypothetical protein